MFGTITSLTPEFPCSKILFRIMKSVPYSCLDQLGAVTEVISFFTLQDEADGSNEYNQYQRGSLNTTKQLIEDLNNIDIVFHIGDICYANGYLSQWDQFTAQVESITSTVPYMIARFGIILLQTLLENVHISCSILCDNW